MGLLVVLLTALAACAVLLAPLMLPGLVFVAALLALFELVLHVHRRYGILPQSRAGGSLKWARWPLATSPEGARVDVALPRERVAPTPSSSSLGEVTTSSIGLDLVRLLRDGMSPAVGAHDAVAKEGVCPILSGLPDGSPLANRVWCLQDRKSELLQAFQGLSSEVAAHNLYPVAGAEAEQVIEALSISLREDGAGERLECDLCGRVLEGLAGWRQEHIGRRQDHGPARSPRSEIITALRRADYGEPPSARRVLEVFDDTVARFVAELGSVSTDAERNAAGQRLMTAVAIHDSVESGILCPILKRAPGGGPLAARLHEGFAFHALLQRSWEEIKSEGAPDNGQGVRGDGAERVLEALVGSFEAHQHDDMAKVTRFFEDLPAGAFRTRRSPLDDIMWPWHSEGAALLAIRMALWADSAPTRAHAVTLKHPSSRALRSVTHLADNFLDHRDRASARATGGRSR